MTFFAQSRPTTDQAELVEALSFLLDQRRKKDSPLRLAACGSRSGQASTGSGMRSFLR